MTKLSAEEGQILPTHDWSQAQAARPARFAVAERGT
jgi:hypothetical protein